MYRKIIRYKKPVNKDNYHKLIYVLHFPKREDGPFENCRPEVFAQSFRFLSDIMFESEYGCGDKSQKIMTKLHSTYHVGEDFLDIVDGIRAIDEALLFCGIGRGAG